MRILEVCVALVLVACSGGPATEGPGTEGPGSPHGTTHEGKGSVAPEGKTEGELVCRASSLPPLTMTPPGMAAVRGNLDSASCDSIAGWAQDPNDPSTQIPVAIYADGVGPAQATAFVASPTAGTKRPDLCTAIMSCDHGFSVPTPTWLRDGQAHKITAFGISVTPGVGNAALGMAQTVTCPLAGTAEAAPPTLPCSSACEETNPQEFKRYQGYRLLECGCTAGGGCFEACQKSTTMGADSACGRCLAAQSAEGTLSTCSLGAQADCANDGACQNYQACAGGCQ